MNSPNQSLQHLISPEILYEIQSSFLKKHGVAVCLYEKTLQPVVDFPTNIPALELLSDEQKNLFESFFDLSYLNAELLQKPRRHTFEKNAVCRSVFPILFKNDFMGLAVLVRFSKTINPKRDEHLLQTLSLVKYKSLSLKTLQDEIESPDEEMKALSQELQNILHLFLEAGIARAHVSSTETIHSDQLENPPQQITAILFCDPKGQIVDSASNAAEFLGYDDPGDLSDLNFLIDLLATDYDREKIRMLFQVEPGATTSVALRLEDGTTIQADVQVNIQRTTTGIIGFECMLSRTSEMTEPPSSQDAPAKSSSLRYDENRLTELQSTYGRLQHQLAHIASPLSQKLDKFFKVQVDDPAIKKQLSDIHHLIKSLSHLNQQLACFVLQEAPGCEPVDFNQLLKKITSQLKTLIPASITIKTKFTPDVPNISANAELLVHAIGNLCKNAIEAMSEGILEIETRIESSDECDKCVSIIIRDSGSGFASAIKKNIFEPFHSTKKSAHAGLGLPAVYGIVKSHGGTISIDSKPKAGSSITLQFPVIEEMRSESSQKDSKSVKGYVLIVDDEAEIADVTAMALRRAGYGVFTSTTCEEAFDIVNKFGHKLDLFIVDNQLIGAKGVTCAQDMLSKVPDVPILFYSGAEEDLELMAFIKRTGAGWLKKPFTAKELLSHVESLLRSSHK